MRYNPLKELVLARTREFFREPEAIFWVYVFPVLLMAGLGIAFPGGGETVNVGIVEGGREEDVRRALDGVTGFHLSSLSLEEARRQQAAGKVDLVVEARGDGYRYIYDPSRMGTAAAKARVDAVLQAAAGRKDPVAVAEEHITEPGSRYIDWLIPGILGMNIMGGGMWGLGFVTVDLRMRKLLKRFVATPMRRSDFLLALMSSRLLFLIPETIALITVGCLLFGLRIQGSILTLSAVSLAGAVCFSGIGLLIACRTDKIEVVSNLMNFVMLPMWLLSGIFFSSERFPEAMQPVVQALPLTQLNNALRGVILQGAPLTSQWLPLLVLAAYGAVSFAAALRWFKWQ